MEKTKRELELEEEVMNQWFTNHSEHCGKALGPPWPHQGTCGWPLPAVLASLSPSEVYLLLLSISGEFAGLLS